MRTIIVPVTVVGILQGMTSSANLYLLRYKKLPWRCLLFGSTSRCDLGGASRVQLPQSQRQAASRVRFAISHHNSHATNGLVLIWFDDLPIEYLHGNDQWQTVRFPENMATSGFVSGGNR